jgi:chromosome partitioning protein
MRENQTLQFLDTPIGARKAFSNAAAHGLAVTELKPADPKAVKEIMALYRYTFDIIGISSRNQKKRA